MTPATGKVTGCVAVSSQPEVFSVSIKVMANCSAVRQKRWANPLFEADLPHPCGIELAEKIKKGQFKFGKLGGRRATLPEIWRAALAA